MDNLKTQSDTAGSQPPIGTPPIPPQGGGTSPIHEGANPNGDKRKSYHIFRNAPKWIEMLCALALVGITATYTYYAGGQLDQMRDATKATQIAADAAKKSADTAEHSFQMERRRAEDMEEAICRVQGGGTAALDNIYPVQIINSGKVSARNVEAHIEISLNAIPSNQKIRTLATLTISANEIPKEKDEARRLNLPLSSHDWGNIADTKEVIVQSGTLKYENGFDRINNETVCDVWLYFRTPEDKLNPIQGRGSACGRLPELLRSFVPKRKQ